MEFSCTNDYQLQDTNAFANWLKDVVRREGRTSGEICYIFCDDNYLSELNRKYLNHDTLTDVITFDYSSEEQVSGDIFISTERVEENAQNFGVSRLDETARVMVHGLLHLLGYNDKSTEEKGIMTDKEDYYLSLRTF